MTNPPRLLDDELDDFERALLSSAQSDRSSARARMRALAVFGALGGKLASANAAASVAGAGASAAAHGGLPSMSAGMLAKWLGAGIVAGTLSAGTATAVHHSLTTERAGPATRTNVPLAPKTAGGARTPVAAEPEAGGAVVPAPRAPERAPSKELAENATGTALQLDAPPLTSSGAFPVETPESRLREEVAVLDRARQALGRRQAAEALREIKEYERRFPAGALAREATLLAVEARLESGDVAGAKALAARAFAADPNSPHARRLRELLEKDGHR
jgi:TolA-binding protein